MITIAAIAIGVWLNQTCSQEKILRLHPYHPYHPYITLTRTWLHHHQWRHWNPAAKAFFVSLGTSENQWNQGHRPDGLCSCSENFGWTSQKKAFSVGCKKTGKKQAIAGYCRLILLSSIGYIHIIPYLSPPWSKLPWNCHHWLALRNSHQVTIDTKSFLNPRITPQKTCL